MNFNSLTVRILAGLLLGLFLGAFPPLVGQAWQDRVVDGAGALGGLWLDALRMTIVPLVFSLLVVGVSRAADTLQAGGLAARILVVFAVLLLAAAVLSLVATSILLQLWPAPREAAEALRNSAQGAARQIPPSPPLAEMLRSFVPSNPVKAAADGAMASLVVFALAFGMAITRLGQERRASLLQVFDAVQAAMMVIVEWVLWAAPAGVFFLALVVGATTGFGAVGVLGHYVVVVSIMCLLSGAIGLVLALAGGRTPAGPLFQALIPVEAMAISTQSSLASLPVMLEATERIGVPAQVRGLVLPMAVALFRITSPAANLAVALYVAHIYGIEVDPARLALGAVVATLVSLAAVGVASAVTFFTTLVPISMALGLPMDLLPLFLAVETLPDFSRTVGNVTGDVGVTAWVARWKTAAKA